MEVPEYKRAYRLQSIVSGSLSLSTSGLRDVRRELHSKEKSEALSQLSHHLEAELVVLAWDCYGESPAPVQSENFLVLLSSRPW